MKKLTVCLTLAALAMVSSLQAADSCCEKAQTTSAKKKTKATVATKMAASCSGEQTGCDAKKAVVKVDHTVKGATLLALR